METVLQQNLKELEPGINVENIEAVISKLQEAIGEEWVSDDPTILSGYWRDFSTTVGRRPNVIALPASTEEVQKAVRIAYEHKIPVVPLTTGFNHGGMVIPRRGGIVLDLKRMDNICEVDEESMTITVSPHIRLQAAHDACDRKLATDGLRLRIAGPITLASVSLLSNFVSGGMSHIAYKTGGHHEHIVSMTWVLPDGSILKTGCGAVEGADNVGVCGPGPDIGGMFLNAGGSFGICTEITIRVFSEPPREKTYYLNPFDDRNYEVDDSVNFFYRVSRENFIRDMYKTGNRHSAIGASSEPESILQAFPIHSLLVGIAGLDDEEMALKKARLDKHVEEDEHFYYQAQEVLDMFYENVGMTEEEAQQVMMKKVYMAGRVMRWRGSFVWVGFPVKMEKAPEIDRHFRKIVDRYWKPTDPKIHEDMVPWGTSMQGPMQMGRLVTVEFDFYVDQGNPEEIKRFTQALDITTEEMVKRGCTVFRVVGSTNLIMFPYLGVYAQLVKKLKDMLDPDNIFHPDILPVTDDYIG